MEKPDKPCDTATLVDIADNIATSAREAIQIIDNILNSANPGRSRLDSVVAGMAEYMLHAPKPGDTPFDAIRTQLRSAVDACELLQRQLGDASSREYSALETEHAAFWPSLRAVMDIWLRNTRNGLEFLTQDAVPKANWKGKVAQSFRAAVLQRVRGVEKLLEGLLGDSQMVLAMLNVQRDVSRGLLPDDRLCRDFLASDLTAKARELQARMSSMRQGHDVGPEWGQNHSRLIDVALELSQRVRKDGQALVSF